MFGKLTEFEIEELLSEQFLGRIGCHAKDKTYVVPISYVYDKGYVFCLTHEGMKTRIMRENPKVCFEVDVQKNAATWKSVIAWGRFEELLNEEDRLKGLQILLGHGFTRISSKALKSELDAQYPFLPDDLSNIKGIVFRIWLEEKTGMFDVFSSMEPIIVG